MKKSFLISFILLSLCFLPALRLTFAHHDNVRFFNKFYPPPAAGLGIHDPQYSMVYLLGRPLTAEIHQIIYAHISNIKDLCVVRWITVFAFAICAGLLSNILFAAGLKPLESLALSIAVFILPGVQDAVIMLALQNALAILTVLWAHLILQRPHQSTPNTLWNFLVAFCLILTSMFLYPQWTFFLFVPLLAKYLTAPPQNLRLIYHELLRTLFLFFLTALFYFFFIKTFVAHNDTRAGAYAFTIDLNFFYWKFFKVFMMILPMSFNLWNIHTITWLGAVLMGVTILLLRKRSILCFLIIILPAGFWLLVRADLILHRIFYVTSVMALITFLIAIRNSLRQDGIMSKYIMVGAMTAGLLGVHYLTLTNAFNYHIEFAFIKQRLTEHQGPISRIHIVLPQNNGKGYNGQTTVDDTFNARTASYNFNTDTLNLLKAALKDNHVPISWGVYSCEKEELKCINQPPKHSRILVTHSSKGQPLHPSPGTVLIDLNDL